MFSQASHNSRLSAIPPVPGEGSVLHRVAELIADLRPDDVDLLKGLHRIQHEFRYIPGEAVPLLAERLDTTPAIIYGTIDFYSELRTAAPAEHVVEWCSGPACRLKNSMGIRRALEAELSCAMGERSGDDLFELRLVQCDGTCDLAPLIRYRQRYLGPLLTSDAIGFARQLKAAESNGSAASGAESAEPAEAAEVDEAVVSVTPEGVDLAHDSRATPLEPRPPLPPDHDPTREPGE